MNYEYKIANEIEFEQIWNKNINMCDNLPDKRRWTNWKKVYAEYNKSGKGKTFVVLFNGEPIGEGTLLFSSECGAICGRLELADNLNIANINALRNSKAHENQGHISRLVKFMENYAKSLGYKRLTIGVEARETRNLAIYLHWGFNEFVFSEVEDGELVLYYAKNIL